MRRVPVILTGVVGLVLLAVAVWCVGTVRAASELREQLEERVGLAVEIQSITSALDQADRPDELVPVAAGLDELARTMVALRGADDSVAARAGTAARRGHELVAITEHADAGAVEPRRAIERELDEIIRALRGENAKISAQLGELWNAINVVVALVVALCAVSTALLGYVLIVALPRAREADLRLERLGTRLAGLPSAQGISHGVGGPLTVAMTNLQLLREQIDGDAPTTNEQARDLLDDALHSLARATGTLQDLRGTSNVDEEAPPARMEPVHAPAKLRILLIDDDEMVVASTKRVLGGHEVQAEHDGAHGIARALAETFDLILCDLMMPGQTGIDVYRTLQEQRPELVDRFVVMSGGANDDRSAAFLDEYRGLRLDKPFGTKQLRELVARFDPLPHAADG